MRVHLVPKDLVRLLGFLVVYIGHYMIPVSGFLLLPKYWFRITSKIVKKDGMASITVTVTMARKIAFRQLDWRKYLGDQRSPKKAI